MSLRRFRGTALAIAALVGAAGAWLAVDRVTTERIPTDEELREPIFRFEKEDLVGFRVERPDETIEMRQVDGAWRAVGRPWRPSRSMVRRVAHQLHDLTARAIVVDAPEDYGVYGLGDAAVTVTLTLRDGSELRFQAGDPNPTSVSWYIRPLPGDRVFVVKKSALDYYRLPLEAYREDRFATFDARAVDTLDAVLPERTLAFHRTGEHSWRQTEPIAQDASRDRVRMMLGRVSAMKALAFVEDGPEDLARYGMDPPAARITVGASDGETVTILLGASVAGTDPPQRYAYRVEDDAVYAVRDGALEPYELPLEDYRNTVLLGRHEWDVQAMKVRLGMSELAIERTADDWRWPDGSAIPGSTPKRVAGRAADIRALGFHDAPPADADFDPPFARVALTFADGAEAAVLLGNAWQVEVGEGEAARTETRRYARIDGDPVVYVVDGGLGEVVEDLHREFGRKLQREAERTVDLGGEDG